MRLTKLWLLIAFCLPAIFAKAQDAKIEADTIGPFRLTLMPPSHLMPLFTGDARVHRISLLNVINSFSFIGSMGGVFPVVRAERNAQAFQLSVASSLYTTLDRHIGGGSLVNTDFFVDLFFDFRLTPNLVLRTGAGHTSQHLSDDAVNHFLNINYVRDYYLLYASYQLPQLNALVYGGMAFNNNLKTTNDTQAFDLSNTPHFQVGFEHAPVRLSKYAHVYWAGDLKVKGEVNYGTSQNIQAGLRFRNANGRAIRIAGNYSWGYDERGQFYTRKREFMCAGFYFDF